uniref:JmjC domain-containing protein n=1 Tax=Globisporangium ultimum (strain ATCC 200006 / CBS 805.95 / DAOM BR144) TaxID=431595 RepID=K3W726_GLOUD
MDVLAAQTPTFLPDFARQCTREPSKFSPDTLHTLAAFAHHQQTVVDIACKAPSSTFYSGEERSRQNVELKFGDFVLFYEASHAGQRHWLQDVDDLEFYLCQCPIAVYRPDATCSQPVLPKIMDEFMLPESVASYSESLSQVNLWIAVHSSRTSLHYDAYRNILVVLYGRKVVTLYPPSETRNLYAYPVHTKSTNHSQVNVAQPDLVKHPRFVNATSQRFIVNAGDALVIPEGWWHQVDSDAYTIAVNFWFDGVRQQLAQAPDMTPYYSRVLLEDLMKRETDAYLQQRRQRMIQQELGQERGDFMERILRCQSQAEKENMLIALDTLGPSEFRDAQVRLASEHPSEWRFLLENASEDFVAVLTTSWEAEEEAVAFGNDSNAASTDLSVLFNVFTDDSDGERLRSQLMQKKETFQHKICAQVMFSTFGLNVVP